VTDRTVLADALESASVEMLREDAAYARVLSDNETDIGLTMQRLAALALAVSQAAHTSDARIEQAGRADYLILDIPLPDTHTMGYGACELIPALAATLRGAP
jgi:hypothetical protein